MKNKHGRNKIIVGLDKLWRSLAVSQAAAVTARGVQSVVAEVLEPRRLMSLAAAGQPINVDHGASDYAPVMATDANDDTIVVWQQYNSSNSQYQIVGRVYNASGDVSGTTNPAFTIASTSGTSSPAVAMNAEGDLVVAWVDNRNNEYGDIYASTYTISNDVATLKSSNFEVNNANELDSNNDAYRHESPSVAIFDSTGDFIATWSTYDSNESPSTSSITAKPFGFSSPSVSAGSEITLATTATADVSDYDPRVAAYNGSVVITWDANVDFNDVYEQQYSAGVSGTASLTAVGGAVLVSQNSDVGQVIPSVAMDANGDFAIAWSNYLSSNSYDVEFQQYKPGASGQPATLIGVQPTVVTTTTASYAPQQSIAYDAAGGLVVVYGTGTSENRNIYAQQFDSTGAANPTAATEVTTPSSLADSFNQGLVTSDGNLNYFVAWDATADNIIYARQFGLNLPKLKTVANSNGLANISNNSAVSTSLAGVVVTFNQSMDTSGSGSVNSSSNWSLTSGGNAVTLSGFSYNSSAEQESFNFPSALASGSYVLTASGSIDDSDLIPLGGNGATLGTAYTLDFTVPSSLTSTITPSGSITSPTATENIQVTYSAKATIVPASINASNISVVAPGGTPLTVTVSSAVAGTDTEVVNYLVQPPTGSTWTFSANNTYTVKVVGGTVTDSSGQSVTTSTSSTQATFVVDVPVNAVTATVTAAEITAATQPGTITVVYTGSSGPVDADTISAGNVSLAVGGATVITSQSSVGDQLTAVYSVPAPSGGWTFAQDGSYTIDVAAGSGGISSAVTGQLVVNVPGDIAIGSVGLAKGKALPIALPGATLRGLLVSVSNETSAVLTGALTVDLFASPTPGLSSQDLSLKSITTHTMKLKSGHAYPISLGNIVLPSTAGDDYLVSEVFLNGVLQSNAVASTSTVQIVTPAISLISVGYAGRRTLPASALGGSVLKGVVVEIHNTAGTAFVSAANIQVYASSTPQITSTSVVLETFATRPTNFRAGASVGVALKPFALPESTTSNTWYLVASTTITGNTTAAVVASGTSIVVSPAFIDIKLVDFPAPVANALGSVAEAVLEVVNLGNVSAIGQGTVTFTNADGGQVGPAKPVKLHLIPNIINYIRVTIGPNVEASLGQIITATIDFPTDIDTSNATKASDAVMI